MGVGRPGRTCDPVLELPTYCSYSLLLSDMCPAEDDDVDVDCHENGHDCAVCIALMSVEFQPRMQAHTPSNTQGQCSQVYAL